MNATILLEKRLYAYAPAIGAITVLSLGIVAALALLAAALWIVTSFCFLVVASIVTTCHAIAMTFSLASPTVQLLVYVLLAYALYRAGRALLRKRENR